MGVGWGGGGHGLRNTCSNNKSHLPNLHAMNSFNGISDTGGSWIVSSLLTLFGAFELQQGWESDGQAAKEVFMSIHDAAKGCAANLPEFPSDVGSRTGCLCRVDLSR